MNKEPKHYDYVDLIRQLSRSRWGREFEDEEAGQHHMMENPEKMMAWALMEFLNRLSGPPRERGPLLRAPKVTEESGTFPDVEIGDKLYECEDSGDGVRQLVVLWKDADGHCLVAYYGEEITRQFEAEVFYASKYLHSSLEDELRSVADKDRKYHEPELAKAMAIIKDLDSGADLTKYLLSEQEDHDEENGGS